MNEAIKVLEENLEELKSYYEIHWDVYDIDQKDFNRMQNELSEIRAFENAINLIKESENGENE